MGNILLTGKQTEILNMIKEYLAEDFGTPFCPFNLTGLQGMMRVVRPEVVIISLFDMEEIENTVFEWLNNNYASLPIIVAAPQENWKKVQDYCVGNNYTYLTLPIEKQAFVDCCYEKTKEKRPIRKEKSPEDAETENKIKKVLVVDDSPMVIRVISNLLKDTYEVVFAVDGKQAVEKVTEEHPDAVLLDYEMPNMDGKDTLEAIRKLEEGKKLPVVFLTGVSDKEKITAVLKDNPAGYLLKPVDREKIMELLEKIGHSL